ncbi:hypothetical protein PINS_up011232 [Pythium insidiosum]|nr:hypothetical protein PINS_up011232 [Pythium insidiosum]
MRSVGICGSVCVSPSSHRQGGWFYRSLRPPQSMMTSRPRATTTQLRIRQAISDLYAAGLDDRLARRAERPAPEPTTSPRQAEDGAIDQDADGVLVCRASLAAWERFVERQCETMHTRSFEWRDGWVLAVEGCAWHQSRIAREIGWRLELAATANGQRSRDRWLETHGASYVDGAAALLEPDNSLGPSRDMIQRGITRPRGLKSWRDLSTLKIEVGATRRWSDLERKAELWRQYVGVQYVLSLVVTRGFEVTQFRLDAVDERQRFELPRAEIQRIQGPQTLVRFDGRRLLGLAPHQPLPEGFAGGREYLEIDLFDILEQVRGN